MALVNKVFDLLFWPFRAADPIYPLAVFSLVTGVLMVGVFRFTSNQKAIRRVKDRLQAHVLEVRLFQDQLGVVLRAYARILRWTLAYLRHSLKPLVVLLLPLVLLLVQLDLRLGWIPPQPRDVFLVKARLARQAPLDQVSLRLPDGLTLSAPPLRISQEMEVDWRIRAERDGDFSIELVMAGQSFAKQVTVTKRLDPLSGARVRGGLLERFLHPGETPLPRDGPLEALEVKYRRRSIHLGSFEMHWLIPFFVLSLACGFAVKGLLRVEM